MDTPGKEDVIKVSCAKPRLVCWEGLDTIREWCVEPNLLCAGYCVKYACLHSINGDRIMCVLAE